LSTQTAVESSKLTFSTSPSPSYPFRQHTHLAEPEGSQHRLNLAFFPRLASTILSLPSNNSSTQLRHVCSTGRHIRGHTTPETGPWCRNHHSDRPFHSTFDNHIHHQHDTAGKTHTLQRHNINNLLIIPPSPYLLESLRQQHNPANKLRCSTTQTKGHRMV